MSKDYVPGRDSELRPFAVNFNLVLETLLAQVGVTVPQHAQFVGLLDDYVSADGRK